MMIAVPNPSTTQTIFSNNRIPISRTSLHTRMMDPRRTRIFGVDDNWRSPNWDTRRAYTSKVSYPAADGRSIPSRGNSAENQPENYREDVRRRDCDSLHYSIFAIREYRMG